MSVLYVCVGRLQNTGIPSTPCIKYVYTPGLAFLPVWSVENLTKFTGFLLCLRSSPALLGYQTMLAVSCVSV